MKSLLYLIISALGLASGSAKSPNIIVFLTDDQGWGDLSSSGNSDLSTPNIDSLKSEGVSFKHFFVCPVCSPTRAEFLTGRYYPRTGVSGVSRGEERINLDEVTIANLFARAGYTTGAFGKWHNGTQYPYHPMGRGFDQFYGFLSGHWGNYFSPLLDHNGKIVKGEGFCIDDFTSKALSFIRESVARDKPFFAYIPYNTPHSPMQVPESYWKKFKDKKLKMENQQMKEPMQFLNHKRCALAMCENLDFNVGRVLTELKKSKIEKNTIVVWFHDNGPNGIRWNGGMRGKKGSTDEGGCRSPLYIRWPEKIRPKSEVNTLASARDLLPTLCALAGVPTVGAKPFDGHSLKPSILGQKQSPDLEKRHIINHWRSKISVRSQKFRLDARGRLYDMLNDPGQTVPVNGKFPAAEKALKASAENYRTLLKKLEATEERPFILAHPGFEYTQLPARDAIPHGTIKFSSRYPNSSYLTQWQKIEDKISFLGKVEQAGRYQVAIYYASKNPGIYQISFGSQVLKFRIDPHHAEEFGASMDRHPRMESYEKKFKKQKVGELKLLKGEGELLLKAIELPGGAGMELRMITLERME